MLKNFQNTLISEFYSFGKKKKFNFQSNNANFLKKQIKKSKNQKKKVVQFCTLKEDNILLITILL